MTKTITVTAAPGRSVPIHRTTKTGPAGRQLVLTEADGEVELPHDIAIRRRIASGDLVVVKPKTAAPVAPLKTSKE